jgi:site-specific recombinase XerD
LDCNRRASQEDGTRSRALDLPAALVDELTAWDTATKARALETGAQRFAWVFSTGAGTPYAQHLVAADFKRALQAARLAAYFTPHCLRHT